MRLWSAMTKRTHKAAGLAKTSWGHLPSTICSFASGKQGSSASFFDPWTNVKLDHIRNHSGKEHTSEACKDITFIEMKSMDKHFTHHAVEAGNMRKTGKFFGSVTGTV